NSVILTSDTLSINTTYTYFAKGTDAAGNTSCSGAGIFVSYTLVTAGPTVTVNQAGGQADPTNTLPNQFAVVFSEAINTGTFTTADITQNGTASVTTWTITDSGNHTTFTLRATVIGTDGTVRPGIATSAVQDLAG